MNPSPVDLTRWPPLAASAMSTIRSCACSMSAMPWSPRRSLSGVNPSMSPNTIVTPWKEPSTRSSCACASASATAAFSVAGSLSTRRTRSRDTGTVKVSVTVVVGIVNPAERRARRSSRPRRSCGVLLRALRFVGVGVGGQGDAVPVASAAAVLAEQRSYRREVLLQERRPIGLPGKAHLGLHRNARDLVPLERRAIEQHGGVALEPLADVDKALEGELLPHGLEPPGIAPRRPRGYEEGAGHRLIETLDEVALAALAHPAHETRPLQLLHVVVDVLAGLFHAARHGGCRQRRTERLEHLHPHRVGQRLERLGFLDQLDLAVQRRLSAALRRRASSRRYSTS